MDSRGGLARHGCTLGVAIDTIHAFRSAISSHSSSSTMDPLSDVLSLLRPRSFMSGGVDHGGDWAISFGKYEGIKFQAVISGGCWLVVEGVDEPVRVEAGDCYLLPHGRQFHLASDLSLKP